MLLNFVNRSFGFFQILILLFFKILLMRRTCLGLVLGPILLIPFSWTLSWSWFLRFFQIFLGLRTSFFVFSVFSFCFFFKIFFNATYLSWTCLTVQFVLICSLVSWAQLLPNLEIFSLSFFKFFFLLFFKIFLMRRTCLGLVLGLRLIRSWTQFGL